MERHTVGSVLRAACVVMGLVFSALWQPSARADIPPDPPRPQPRPRVTQAGPPKYRVATVVRWFQPAQSFGTLGSYVPFPLPVQDGLKQLLGEFAKVADLNAPAELAVALYAGEQPNLDAPPPWAVAFHVKSVEETRKIAKEQSLLLGGSNDRRIVNLPLPGGPTLTCLLMGLAGPGRLACAATEIERDHLAPTLLQKNVPFAAGQDLHAEVSVSTIMSVFGEPLRHGLNTAAMTLPKRLSLGDPAFDRALTDVVQAAVQELSAVGQDLALVTVDLTLHKEFVDLALGYKMSGNQSVWARSDEEAAARKTNGPPATFLALPKTVVAASYDHRSGKWDRKLIGLVFPLVNAFLAKDGLAEADRKALEDTLMKSVGYEGLETTVLGEVVTGKPGAAGGVLGDRCFVSSTERAAGGKDSAPETIRSLSAMWNRPGIQAYLRKKWKALGIKTMFPVLRAENVGKQLGPSSAAMFVSFDMPFGKGEEKGKKVAKSQPFSLYVASAEVGGRVWSVAGANKAAAVEQLLAMGKLQPAQTLAGRTDLNRLREPGWQMVGFSTLAGWISMVEAVLREAEKNRIGRFGEVPNATSLLSVIPHHGEVPMVYGMRGGSIGPLGLSKMLTVTIPKLVIEDTIALLQNLGANK